LLGVHGGRGAPVDTKLWNSGNDHGGAILSPPH